MDRVQAGRAHTGPWTGFVGLLALLGALAATVGVGTTGWVTGVGCGAGGVLLVERSLTRHHRSGLGPADRVTLARAVLVVAAAALVADSFLRPATVPALVTLCAVALVLDAVDGRVARRTGTVSAFGARFDMEVDAFLILVLSAYVGHAIGWWVVAAGAARYAFVAARGAFPWLRGSIAPRPWCKVVAAVQGVVLTVVAAGVLPLAVSRVVVGFAVLLLAESFGRETRDLWRARERGAEPTGRGRTAASTTVTVLAAAAVWFALVAPVRVTELTPGAFLRIPLEGLVVVALVLLVGPRTRRVVATLVGVVLGPLVVVKLLDMGFYAFLDRPFDPLSDWYYLGPGIGVLGDSSGRATAVAAVVLAVVLVVGIIAVLPLSVARLARLTVAHRRESGRAVAVLSSVWLVCAVTGVQAPSGGLVASSSASGLVHEHVSQLSADLHDRATFSAEIGRDVWGDVPDDDLLGGLRGKDVLLVFVESYGRVAVEGSSFAPGVRAVLEAGTAGLDAEGFASRSAFLTSPTFGGASWLAHSTLQSGLWVDTQQRYQQLLTRDRLTLTDAFGRAGWRTVFDVPSDTEDWVEGADFYGFDEIYDVRNVGYRGPRFGYATMPDQYVLSAFQRLELTESARRLPVMAEIDLVSSHHPWTPLPEMVDWDAVGDGSVFDATAGDDDASSSGFRDADEVRAAYGRSVEYSLTALISWVLQAPDPDLVLVVLGDHQPHSYVTGEKPGHDVPISVIAHDPDVIGRISGWGWQHGLEPGPDAPVWRMDTFRDRFLSAYSDGEDPG